MFTEEELALKKFKRTSFYQTILYRKLEDVIIEKQFKLQRACEHLGEKWRMVSKYLSTPQKANLDELVKKYGRNGGRRLRRISTSAPRGVSLGNSQ